MPQNGRQETKSWVEAVRKSTTTKHIHIKLSEFWPFQIHDTKKHTHAWARGSDVEGPSSWHRMNGADCQRRVTCEVDHPPLIKHTLYFVVRRDSRWSRCPQVEKTRVFRWATFSHTPKITRILQHEILELGKTEQHGMYNNHRRSKSKHTEEPPQ